MVYENAIISEHALEQMEVRGISTSLIRAVLQNPQEVLSVRPGAWSYSTSLSLAIRRKTIWFGSLWIPIEIHPKL